MKSNEFRRIFLEFFKERGHKICPSSPLIPRDPTLLFTSAGMVQFKPLWSGESPLTFRRATSCQKCLRATDLEQVGFTPRHLTFFEMLGNFSFGDYFKLEAIKWAWEFVTEVMKLPRDRLYISVYEEDEEAYNIWRDEIGISPDRIYKFGKEDNFWGPAGDTGPCGPCTEIFYDLGEEIDPGKTIADDSDRYFEVWNLVFPQYDAQKDGTLKPLKNRGVDTGMGLERALCAMQGKKTVFETDVFEPIIQNIEDEIKIKYFEKRKMFNIIADHIRALTFAISEGVFPGNTGREYVIRRILRRAVKEYYDAGIKGPLLYKFVKSVVDVMGDAYPEIKGKVESVSLVIKAEEKRFLDTLSRGKVIFTVISNSLKEKGKREFPPEEAFKLYDTYGFPFELTEEYAKKEGFEISREKFEKYLEKQRELAKRYAKFKAEKFEWNILKEIEKDEFVGYNTLKIESRICMWRKDDKKYYLILERTPFYAEEGGQVGDTGRIYNDDMEFIVEDTQYFDKYRMHIGILKQGQITEREVICEVDKERRLSIQRNHTATHLLQSALRKVLGEHVHQAGSLVAPDRLRFDFTHFCKLEKFEVDKIRELVNEWIMQDVEVLTYNKKYFDAIAEGAIALPGAQYGEIVRVVDIKGISKELCGGTHCRRTGEIGFFEIIEESAIHAGVRRIVALTGFSFLNFYLDNQRILLKLANMMGVDVNNVLKKVEGVLSERDLLEKKLNEVMREMIKYKANELREKSKKVNGVEVIMSEVSFDDIEYVRSFADVLRKENSVGVLGFKKGNKPSFIVFVGDKLKDKLKAGDLARELGKLAGAGGGGKPHMAQAGGAVGAEVSKVLKEFEKIIIDKIKKLNV